MVQSSSQSLIQVYSYKEYPLGHDVQINSKSDSLVNVAYYSKG